MARDPAVYRAAQSPLPAEFWTQEALKDPIFQLLYHEITLRLREENPEADILELMLMERVAFLYVYIRSKETESSKAEEKAKAAVEAAEKLAAATATDVVVITTMPEVEAEETEPDKKGKAKGDTSKADAKAKEAEKDAEGGKVMGFAHDRAYKETLQLWAAMAADLRKTRGATGSAEKIRESVMAEITEAILSVLDDMPQEQAEVLREKFAQALSHEA